MTLGGQAVIVTGASSGIGRAVAERLLAQGARVAGIDRSAAALDRPGYRHFEADVRDEAAVEQAVDAAVAVLEGVDGLVHAAGTFASGNPFYELTMADWQRVVATNLDGTFLVGRAVARRMLSRKRGKIVNVACVRSVIFRPGMAEYAASKAGVAALTSAMALDLAPHGIQVNAVAPGFTWTGMTDRSFSDPGVRSRSEQLIPAGRIAKPEDMVGPITFLLSSDADYVTGEVLFVDGGFSRFK